MARKRGLRLVVTDVNVETKVVQAATTCGEIACPLGEKNGRKTLGESWIVAEWRIRTSDRRKLSEDELRRDALRGEPSLSELVERDCLHCKEGK